MFPQSLYRVSPFRWTFIIIFCPCPCLESLQWSLYSSCTFHRLCRSHRPTDGIPSINIAAAESKHIGRITNDMSTRNHSLHDMHTPNQSELEVNVQIHTVEEISSQIISLRSHSAFSISPILSLVLLAPTLKPSSAVASIF